MTVAEIAQTANDFLVSEFEVDADEISADANFSETLGLDSLDYIDLVVVIESNFGVKFGEKDFKEITTFEDFYQAIAQKIQQKNS
ncbi:acyl carrier protein [Cruoricaptor ignavus]|uniref:Acyl carrier protein n=1 Tax=Cruoricaptor ignavus TaxID=1118202 RepID=A0A1M6DYA2_9FLAO|nr:phosphopantetheine-binding protein [Cruoricaptor ignavus]SHI78110.1 acyl carrier protein [Cruoricaptor ignavus]